MQQPATLDRLTAFTELPQRAVTEHAALARVRAGRLTRREYTLLLWGLRCWHLPVEQMVWDSRSDTVRRARQGLQRKVPLLERDLVAVCGKELVVPAELNRALDGFAQLTTRGTTPARLIGRLFVFERLFTSVAGAAAPVEAALSLSDDATHYLRGCEDPRARLDSACAVFATCLTGEVPLQNAVEGARELLGQAHELLDMVGRLTTLQAAAS